MLWTRKVWEFDRFGIFRALRNFINSHITGICKDIFYHLFHTVIAWEKNFTVHHAGSTAVSPGIYINHQIASFFFLLSRRVLCFIVSWLNASVFFFFLGFKLKDFLRDNETLSHFLHHNASLPHHALKQIVEADVNLEKVEYPNYSYTSHGVSFLLKCPS